MARTLPGCDDRRYAARHLDPCHRAIPDPIRVATDRADLDLDWTFAALSERAYWALGRDREVFERSVAGSLVYVAPAGDRGPAGQVGFARVVTDEATFAWI